MNVISEIESELAYAVLIERRHSEKLDSDDLLPLIKRLNDALASLSLKDETVHAAALVTKTANVLSH